MKEVDRSNNIPTCRSILNCQESVMLWSIYSLEYFSFLGHSNLITCLTSFFWKKNPVRLKKKKKKKVAFGVLRTKVVLKFSVRLKKKKKSASFKNILCKGDSINYMKLSLL